ncbi:MAG TPA: hypothetical protein VHB48_11590 [Chitinophagaceae bacterium]|nr:hypothetical protein [Chitinophagaceae bacterium]
MKNIARTGYYAALTAATASAGFTAVQILQVAGVTHYPLDAVLIYASSLCIAPPFVLTVLSLHYVITPVKKFWSHSALVFSVIYLVFAMLVYIVQLGAVIPYKLTSEVLVVTPHSLFWTIDAIAYINMGIAAFFMAQLFGKHGLQMWLRNVLLLHALTTPLVVLVYFYPVFSIPLLLLASPWSITSVASLILLSLYFKKVVSS